MIFFFKLQVTRQNFVEPRISMSVSETACQTVIETHTNNANWDQDKSSDPEFDNDYQDPSSATTPK